MKDAQKPDHITFTALLSRLRDGRFVIPDFQREFEWNPWDIRDLMRSIFLDYYIGSLLLWRGKEENFSALACESIKGYSGDGQPEHIVLDGQQRLTAIHYAFLSPDMPLPKRANRFLYFIRVDRFMNEDYDEAFDYQWTQGAIRLLDDLQAQFRDHYFPLSVIGQGGWELFEWVKGYEQYWQQQAEAQRAAGNAEQARVAGVHEVNARRFGKHLKETTEQYQIAFIELDRDLELDKVCDIFTQINSKGIRLDIFDLINALIRPRGLQLKELWREAKLRLEFVDTERMNVYILQVMSIIRQTYCSPKYLYYLLPGQKRTIREGGELRQEMMVASIEDFESLWHRAVDALDRAIKLLRDAREYGAVSSTYLPYVSILPAFAALQVKARALTPERQLDAQRKIRHWYWASVFTNRYSGSVESTTARDFQDVAVWFEDDMARPGLLEEFESRFRRLDLRKEVKRGSSVYNGIFNLFVLRGARDWMTGLLPQHGDLDDHHIVPQSWGRLHGLGTAIDTVLNRTPLTSETNQNVIGEDLPNDYLPQLLLANENASVRAIMESHFISPAALEILLRRPFTVDDFEAFLNERQRTIHDAIENLLIKERLDLSPQLRELDERVEKAELAIRREIERTMDSDGFELPSHVAQKVSQRLQSRIRRNPGLDLAHYETLAGQLEFADLRELQDTICSKALWHYFEPRFVVKEGLAIRFDQLAELRNGLKHSRTVDEITRKDGEAALLWFEQVLGR